MRFPIHNGKNNTSYLSNVPSKSGSKSSRTTNFDDSGENNTGNNTSTEVGKLSENVVYIKTADGQYATLNVSENTSNKQILEWGNRFGVDMSPYLN